MKCLSSIVAICAGLLLSCTSQAKQGTAEQISQQKQDGKTLVVFFSHAGDNYAVGNIKVGNTKRVADAIRELTGAEQFEIVADRNYDLEYTHLTELVKQEVENNEFPTYKGKIDNLDQYTTIYIGGPIWWGTYPRVMFTFFRDNDLSGKTIIPFATHEGSGMGGVQSLVQKTYLKANVLKGFAIRGTDCQKSDIKERVKKIIADY